MESGSGRDGVKKLMSTNVTNGNGQVKDNAEAAASPEPYAGSMAAGEVAPDVKKLTRADFVSGQEVRWCPGCGDYSILNNVQKVMPELGVPRERIVFISGIGCSSRFPYYMNTYGFHTIHGRAPGFATGVKTANPDLRCGSSPATATRCLSAATTSCTSSVETWTSTTYSSTTASTV
jgi:hypothetical protein